MTSITHLQCHKALKAALNRNYRFKWLDVEFGRESITWYIAVQFKNDKEYNWHPRIAMFFPKAQRVCVLEKLGGKELWMDVQVLAAMGAAPENIGPATS